LIVPLVIRAPPIESLPEPEKGFDAVLVFEATFQSPHQDHPISDVLVHLCFMVRDNSQVIEAVLKQPDRNTKKMGDNEIGEEYKGEEPDLSEQESNREEAMERHPPICALFDQDLYGTGDPAEDAPEQDGHAERLRKAEVHRTLLNGSGSSDDREEHECGSPPDSEVPDDAPPALAIDRHGNRHRE
jgi:hypothetical protein